MLLKIKEICSKRLILPYTNNLFLFMKKPLSSLSLANIALFLCSAMAFGLTGCLDSDADDALRQRR